MIYGKNELLSLFILLDREKQWKVGNMAPKPGKKFWARDTELRVWGKQKRVEARSFWEAHSGYVLSYVLYLL